MAARDAAPSGCPTSRGPTAATGACTRTRGASRGRGARRAAGATPDRACPRRTRRASRRRPPSARSPGWSAREPGGPAAAPSRARDRRALSQWWTESRGCCARPPCPRAPAVSPPGASDTRAACSRTRSRRRRAERRGRRAASPCRAALRDRRPRRGRRSRDGSERSSSDSPSAPWPRLPGVQHRRGAARQARGLGAWAVVGGCVRYRLRVSVGRPPGAGFANPEAREERMGTVSRREWLTAAASVAGTVAMAGPAAAQTRPSPDEFVRAVKGARLFDLSFTWNEQSPILGLNPPYAFALNRTHRMTHEIFGQAPGSRVSWASEIMYFSGQHGAPTIDAIGHIGRDLKLFGGVDAVTATSTPGGIGANLGIEAFPADRL